MMLKEIKNLGFVFFLTLFAACGGSSSSDSGGGATLVGTWDLTHYSTDSGANYTDISGLNILRVMDASTYTDTNPTTCDEAGTYVTSGGTMTHTVVTAVVTGGTCDTPVSSSWALPYTLASTTFDLTSGAEVFRYTKR